MPKKATKEEVIVEEVVTSTVASTEEQRRDYLLACLDVCKKEGWTKIGQIEAELSRLNAIL